MAWMRLSTPGGRDWVSGSDPASKTPQKTRGSDCTGKTEPRPGECMPPSTQPGQGVFLDCAAVMRKKPDGTGILELVFNRIKLSRVSSGDIGVRR